MVPTATNYSNIQSQIWGDTGDNGRKAMLKRIGPILIILFVFAGNGNAAVPRRAISDEQIVRQAQLVARGDYVEIYQHGVTVEPSFLKIMEHTYGEVGRVSGLQFDTKTLGSKVQVFVSDGVNISHVWKGYQHPSDPRAIIFLNLRAYHGAMAGKNATHAHELTHLFTWRYHSHTLREGIADYVALKIIPGAAVGPNARPDDTARRSIAPEILDHLGTTTPAPDWVSTDPNRRSDYYFASYRFVKYLVESKDLETFWKIYASENPETDIKSLYGLDRKEAVEAALGKR